MQVNFQLRYTTQFGQSLFILGNTVELGNNIVENAIPLSFLNKEFWHTIINFKMADDANVEYKYLIIDTDGSMVAEFGNDRVLDFSHHKNYDISIFDTWQSTADYRNNFYTKAFQKILSSTPKKATKQPKSFTHIFNVKSPLLSKDEQLCIVGATPELGNWETNKPIILAKNENWHSVKLNIKSIAQNFEYKYGIYNTSTKQFEYFEKGNNRIAYGSTTKNIQTIFNDAYANVNEVPWKGAGVAMPLFSLRSKNSFGVGEFTDIALLVDWAKQAGLKLVQLLPINDTIATFTWKDSYPYSAISAFALHPIYINLEKVATKENKSIIKQLVKKQKQLNSLTELDYEQVIKFKLSALKELYQLQKNTLKDDINYFNFFELNRHWLVPYAAFCYLRDKYATAEFSTWKTNNEYNEAALQRLVSPTQPHYDEIAFHYFIQYHLHVQLIAATDYAHKNGIVIKGDLPIGISRNSVDAWVEPSLYNMNEQAGAPPDDFAVKGQNWGFPTYNWQTMQQDGYSWWRKRFEQMGNYFDAFRIDHILGFFRIWSIPLHAVEGILGRFIPALPITKKELQQNGIDFNYERFCEPFINDELLQNEFAEKKTYVKQTFFTGNKLKEEFNTQRKVEDYFTVNNIDDEQLKVGLFNIISNVLLFEEENSHQQNFHFRISITDTSSYKNLPQAQQQKLYELYVNYFYRRQDDFWKKEALQKLPNLKQTTNMLICGEDLGMVPHCVPGVMEQLSMLSLEIQRMPKKTGIEFFHPADAPYLSVITPATHDMSTIREWWNEDREKTQRFYNNILGKQGEAPFYCETWVVEDVFKQHIYSPAMWCIFQLQDYLGMNEKLRRTMPNEERINVPANSNHYWRYRMHLNLEDLLREKDFSSHIKNLVQQAGRD